MWKVLFTTTDPTIEDALTLIGGQLEIPKGHSQLWFLYQKAFFQHAQRVLFRSFLFTLKGHYSEDFYLDRSIIPKVLIPKGHYSEFWNKTFRHNDASE